ncbi:MAG TPA: protein-L-isoaspartate(D-aspartate) O-methyltransferase [Opitutales bacterium]|nr:protein-L-isoaspartate(D-aspartate) O-methyltransferase [Opitutales bacterium]
MVRPRSYIERAVSDKRVAKAVLSLDRSLFVPKELAREASQDRALPIGKGQTISQPSLVAIMTEAICPQPDHRVLEVGAGSGFQAAVLSRLVKEVYAIEIDPELADAARKRLERLRFTNIEIREGDGHDGWIEKAPFDAIIVAAAADDVPEPLLNQLRCGGRMVIPIGTPFGPQELILIEKHQDGLRTRSLAPVRFVAFRRTI